MDAPVAAAIFARNRTTWNPNRRNTRPFVDLEALTRKATPFMGGKLSADGKSYVRDIVIGWVDRDYGGEFARWPGLHSSGFDPFAWGLAVPVVVLWFAEPADESVVKGLLGDVAEALSLGDFEAQYFQDASITQGFDDLFWDSQEVAPRRKRRGRW